MGHDGLELGGVQDAGVAQVFEFGADGGEGAVGGCLVDHFGDGMGGKGRGGVDGENVNGAAEGFLGLREEGVDC